MATRTRIGLGIAAASSVALLVAVGAWRMTVDGAGGQPEATAPVRLAPEPPPPDPWTAVAWAEVESPAFADPGFVYALATDGAQLVAWGELHPRPPAPGAIADAPIWRTTDGVEWTRSNVTDADGKAAWAQQVAFGNDEALALIPVEGQEPRLVTSRGGDDWVDVDLPNGVSMRHLVAVGDGFVVVGTHGERPVVLEVRAGIASAPIQLPGPPDELVVSAVSAVDRHVLAVGTVTSGHDSDGAIWRGGPDGWTVTGPEDELFGAPDVEVSLHGLVPFFGGSWVWGSEGAMPVCAIRAPVLVAGPAFADVCPGPPPAAWVSEDGRAWRRARLPEPADGIEVYPERVIAGGDGLLALVAEQNREGAARAPGLWTSGDGDRWRRIGDGPPVTGPMAILRGRLVVVGYGADERPAVWLGTPVRE